MTCYLLLSQCKLLAMEQLTWAVTRFLFRSYLIGANFNTQGMQNVGITYAMHPGLSAIYKDPASSRQAVKRYVRHYNSPHSFWTPCLVEFFFPQRLASPPEHSLQLMLDKIKDRTTYALSAIGDSVFNGSLLIFWALSSICLLLAGKTGAAIIEGLFFCIGIQVFKVYSFWCGLRGGFIFLEHLKRWDLITLGQRVKYANAAFLLWFWILVWPKPITWIGWTIIGMATVIFIIRLMRQFPLPRPPIPAGIFLAGWILYPTIKITLDGWAF